MVIARRKLAVTNPVLVIPTWTHDDAAVALDWELENGRDWRCRSLAASESISLRDARSDPDAAVATATRAPGAHPFRPFRRLETGYVTVSPVGEAVRGAGGSGVVKPGRF
jgi:hypothetical protein